MHLHSFNYGVPRRCSSLLGSCAVAQRGGHKSKPPHRDTPSTSPCLARRSASLPPMATYTLLGVAQRTPQIVARYGYNPDITRPLAPNTGGHLPRPLDSFGLTGVLPTRSRWDPLGDRRILERACTRLLPEAHSWPRWRRLPVHHRVASTRGALAFDRRYECEIGVGHPGDWHDVDRRCRCAAGVPDRRPTGTSIMPFMTPSAAFVTTSGASEIERSASAVRGLLGCRRVACQPKSALGATSVSVRLRLAHRARLGIAALSFGGAVSSSGSAFTDRANGSRAAARTRRRPPPSSRGTLPRECSRRLARPAAFRARVATASSRSAAPAARSALASPRRSPFPSRPRV